MQIIRTISWIAITAVLVAFIAINWTTVAVNFWPLNNGNYLHFEWPVGVIALIFFAFGMLPVWLYLRAVRWRLNRRIETLEKSLQASLTPAPVASSAPIAPSVTAAPTATHGTTFDTYSPKDL